MTKDNDMLILTLPSALEKVGQGAKRLLSSMVSDALTLARTSTLASATLHRIGDYEFCDLDFLYLGEVFVWIHQIW